MEEREIKLTTIMPVYNMQQYVAEAIESWLKQTLSGRELICIDDCSTDESAKIVQNYAQNNSNIRFFSMEEHGGVGKVRRKAMELAMGEYVSFLDADDKYMRDDALEILYENAKATQCDVCGGFVCDFTEHTITNYPRFRNLDFGENGYVDLKYSEIQDDYFFQGFIYKRKYIKEQKIEFPPFERNEDPPFLVKALYYANIVCVNNIEYYGHRGGHKTVDYTIDSITDLLNGFIMNLEFADVHKLDILFTNTVHRLNEEYIDLLKDWIKHYDRNLLERLFYAEKLANKRGLRLDIVWYAMYLIRHVDCWEDFLFTLRCRDVLRGKRRIVLYGAGNIGTKIYCAIRTDRICDIEMWVDRYKAGTIVNGYSLYGVTDIKTNAKDYDGILIGIDNKDTSAEVTDELLQMGIEKKKIMTWV